MQILLKIISLLGLNRNGKKIILESNNKYNDEEINEIIESINGLNFDENYHEKNQNDNNNIDNQNNSNDKIEDDNCLDGNEEIDISINEDLSEEILDDKDEGVH